MRRLGATRQPWMVPALQPVAITASAFQALTFVHHVTNALPLIEPPNVKGWGNTMWVALNPDGRCIALSFDWAYLPQNVPVVADVLAVCSNVHFIDESGGALPEACRVRLLVNAVMQLDWARVVIDFIPKPPYERSYTFDDAGEAVAPNWVDRAELRGKRRA